MLLQKISLLAILTHILTAPESLGIAAAYSESEIVRYKQYGRYDAVAVRREGRHLLEQLEELKRTQDIVTLRRWQKRYLDWQKKLTQIKFTALVHGEFNEARQIILYVNALHEECNINALDYGAYYQSVLVHERLHYLQHQAILQRFGAHEAALQSAEYKQAQAYWFGGGADIACVHTVKETLAEFVRFVWCREQGYFILAELAVESLKGVRAYYPAYPYAGMYGLCALYTKNPELAVQAWEKLWRASLMSWQEAYRLIKMQSFI